MAYPIENTTSSIYCRGIINLEIINIGRRGLIDKKVSALELEWA